MDNQDIGNTLGTRKDTTHRAVAKVLTEMREVRYWKSGWAGEHL